MKWLLVSSFMMSGQMVYADEKVCNVAAKRLQTVGHEAVCIPKGINEAEVLLNKFSNILGKLSENSNE